MKDKILIAISLILLGACASAPDPVDRTPKTTVRVINNTAYPEFPNLPIPPDVRLLPFEVDFPRNQNQLVVKNITTCVNVPVENQDDRFWARCGENPIDTNSNIFIGLTQDNWNNINSNFEILKENNSVLRGLLNQANKQRAEWRRLAAQERARTVAETSSVIETPPTSFNTNDADG